MSRVARSGVGTDRERRVAGVGLADGRSAASSPGAALLPALRWIALGGALLCQTALLLINLVPASVWASMGYSSNGPLPERLNPLFAGLFYILPAVIGALCRRWQVAVVLATLPAWLDLAIFAVATAARNGPFYLAGDHAASTVGTIELFAVLGAFGWLARTATLLVLSDRRPSDGGNHGYPGNQGANRP